MGDRRLKRLLKMKPCANGASALRGLDSDGRVKFATVLHGLLNYLKLSGATIQGATYGSRKILNTPDGRAELHAKFNELYTRIYGGRPPFCTDDQLANDYEQERAGNYKPLRDAQAIKRIVEIYPLLGDTLNAEEPIASLYLTLGRNQNVRGPVVKLGYTGDQVDEYIARRFREHGERIMATACGAKAEEAFELAKWKRFLADGDEWFYPVEAIFDHYRHNPMWDIRPKYEELVREALGVEATA